METSDDIPKCRLRIRSPRDDFWYDVCNNPTFVRDENNEKWIPMQLGASQIKDPEFADYWMVLSCEFDPEFDNPCEDPKLPEGDCVGQPNDESAGSGNGYGSGGKRYDPKRGYPAGYDLPDAGVHGFNLLVSENSPTGYYIYRPVIGVPHTYKYGRSGASGRGTWNNPLLINDGIYTHDAKITEAIYDISGVTGCIPITFSSINDCCVAIDAYVDGKRVASTCGPACSAGRITACVDNRASDKMMIRVTKMVDELDCASEVVVGPEVDPDKVQPDIVVDPETGGGGTVTPGGGDGDGDGGGAGGLPDTGTPLFPAPCSAAIRPKWADRKNNILTYTVYMGDKNGLATICFDALVGDMIIDILYEGKIIQSTRTGISSGCMEFMYNYNFSENIMIRITTTSDIPSDWELSIYCTHGTSGGGEDGSHKYPFGCDFLMTSKGSEIHKHYYNMGYEHLSSEYDRAMVVIECFPHGGDTTTFTVYDLRGSLIGTYTGNTNGFILIPRVLADHGNDRDLFHVYVESSLGSYWEYRVNCPMPLIAIDVEGEHIPWTPSASRP